MSAWVDAYKDRGWIPIPIPRGAKAPTDPGWQRRAIDAPWPAGEHNIGLLLGEPSGGLVDVDLDCKAAVEIAPAFLPATAAFSRGNERGHLLYICAELAKRETFEHEGMILELRSTGNQTVVPDSIHPSGAPIRWHEPWREPLVITVDELRRRAGAVAALALVATHWPKGGRHEAQLALAGCLLTEGWDEGTTLEALCSVCRIAGDEDRPKREQTVRRTAEMVADCQDVIGWGSLAASLPPEVAKVARGWLGQRRAETIDRDRLKGLAETMTRSGNEERKHLGRLLQRVVRGELVGDDLTPVARAVGTAYPEADVGVLERTFAVSTTAGMRGAIERGQQEALSRDAVAFSRNSLPELGRRVRAVLMRGGEVIADDGSLWRHQGAWVAIPEHEVDAVTRSFDGAPVRGGQAVIIRGSDMKDAIKEVSSLCARPGFFADAPPGVAFRGTFVGVDGAVPLTADHRCRAVYDWEWQPTAACPAWDGFLRETYPGRPDVSHFLAEFAGACLLGAAPSLQRFVVLYGDGGTGKSVVVRVLTGIMPEGSVASVPPQEWQHPYSRARLVGVRFNAVSEMPSTEIFDAESIKAIVSGDAVQARRPYGRPFELHATAGHVFAANELPPVRDQSRGFWRRVVVINHETPPEVMIPDLGDLLLEAERPGIVAWALRAGLEAVKRGAYSLPKDETVERWRVDSDSVASWLRDRCVIGGGPTPTADLYDDYRRTTLDGGQKPVSVVVFSRRMGRLAAVHLGVHRTGSEGGVPLTAVMMGPKEGRIRAWNVSLTGR